MAFHARQFTFDGVPSEVYGLIISSSDNGEGTSNASNDVELVTQNIFRRPVPFFYGVSQTPTLELEAEVTTTTGEITAIDSAQIQKWLFGQNNYKKLRIVQYDMEDIFMNVFLKSPKVKRVGNIIRGFSFTIVCDSPFGWGNNKSITYTESNRTYNFFNESENQFYTYPTITLKMDGGLCNFLIRNVTDNNREFSLTGLTVGETVVIDNDLQIVTATLTPSILDHVVEPVKFFRLLPGANQLYLLGNFVTAKIEYKPMKRIG